MLQNLIEAKDLSIEEINKELIRFSNDHAKVIIKGDVGNGFAPDVVKAKIILEGSLGENACNKFKSSKITVLGSVGSRFGSDMEKSEVYIKGNAGDESFENLSMGSKVVVGGYVLGRLGRVSDDSVLIILNMCSASINLYLKHIDACSHIYIRGKELCDLSSCQEVSDEDEDIYLPLISEFARQFSVSLSLIKEKPFYKIRRNEE